MKCFNPLKIPLSDEEIYRRQHLPDSFPIEYRFARYINVPCGKCEACLAKRKSEWIFRLTKEFENSKSAYFITLTYDTENVPWNADEDGNPINYSVSKRDAQLFLKRLRKNIWPFKVRFFLVSEYGPTSYRPHYHLLLFNYPNELKDSIIERVESAWNQGFVTISSVNPARIAYVCGYCLDNSDLPEDFTKNFMLCSRRPAIGHQFLDDINTVNYLRHKQDGLCYIRINGESVPVRIPRYYRDKIFDRNGMDEIACKNSEYVSDKSRKLKHLQKDWLVKHGYEVNEVTLNTPYPSSPMDLELQQGELFRQRVRKKAKMHKKKI